MALPILNWINRQYPGSYKYWHLARKCAQAAPLFLNHPLIDKIVITDCDEGFGPKDIELAKSCDLVINTMPPHPFGEFWHNDRSMVEETWVQAGIPLSEFHSLPADEKIPKLYRWFETNLRPKTIAVHCFAGYGRDGQRSPSAAWWIDLLKAVTKDYTVVRLGHPNEPDFSDDFPYNRFVDLRDLSFIDQVKQALDTSLYIGTDSGMSLVVGAYSHPQVSLLTNWNKNHTKNPLCLQPINKNNTSLFNEYSLGGCSGIPKESVINTIKLYV